MTDSWGDRLLAYSPLGDDLLADDELRAAKRRHDEYVLTTQIVGRLEVLFTSLQPGQARLVVQNPPGHLTIETIEVAIRELEAAKAFLQGSD